MLASTINQANHHRRHRNNVCKTKPPARQDFAMHASGSKPLKRSENNKKWRRP